MKRLFVPMLGASLVASMPASAATQQADVTQQSNEQTELAEAHAITEIMFPPSTRQKMFDDMLASIMGQLRQSLFADSPTDPGMQAILSRFFDRSVAAQKLLLQKNMPAMVGAMETAYVNEFSLAELKDIRVFAMSPTGRHYLSRSLALINDPAVAKVNMAMFTESQKQSLALRDELKAEIAAYRQEHPQTLPEPKTEPKGQ